MEAIRNNFPIIGGVLTPVLAMSFTTLYQTVILAAIGALTGLFVKAIYEWIVKKITKYKNGAA